MKNKIIIGLGIALGIVLFFLFQKPKVIVKTETKYDTIIEQKFDTIDNTKPTQVKTVTIKVPITKYDTIEKVVYKDIKTNRYQYTDTLSNGIVKSTIFADKIYQRNISLETFDKTVLITTKEVLVRNDWYVTGVVTFNSNKNVLNQGIGLFYAHKGKLLIGASANYNNMSNDVSFPITIGIKF